MIKVSIIIPCYNASAYIENCLNSILNDALDEKEIIFINDGSKDNTLDILKRCEMKHSNIKIINQSNAGQGAARNNGLNIATGEFIFFLDVDDYVEKNTFKIMYDYAKENNCDYVYSDYSEHYEHEDKLIKNTHNTIAKKDAVVANFAPWAKLISKELIDNINFQFCEGKIFEDIAVIPHLAAHSSNPGYLDKALYYYNMANISTTRQDKYNKKYEDIIYASDYMYELFKKDKLLEEYNEELKYIYLDSILKSGVLKFAKYREGIKNIKILRENVYAKFSNLFNNKYYKMEPPYRKLTALISVYLPPRLIELLKKIKR